MCEIEQRLLAAGLSLPPPLKVSAGTRLPFPAARRYGQRLLISGHGPQQASGEIQTLGKLGEDLDVEQGYQAARLVALSMLGSIKRELGSLDRVTQWVRVFGMVNSSATFCDHPSVINGFSDLIIQLYGETRGMHVRSAVGMAQLPFNIPVEVEAEVEWR